MMRMGRIRVRAEPLVLLRRLRDAPARTILTARWSLAEIAARRPEALHRLDLQCIEEHVYVHVRFLRAISQTQRHFSGKLESQLLLPPGTAARSFLLELERAAAVSRSCETSFAAAARI